MTLTMSVEMPDSFSLELRSLLTGLLQRDVHKRLGCRGRGAEETKSHPFFRGIDWRVVFLQRLPPPLIPARGEVNAADAFDIGSFDDEDTKHIKLTEADQELYRNFPVVVSERWQHEIAETIFDYINHEADKAEMKRKNKHKLGYQEEEQSDCILHGYIKRLGGTFTATWLTRYVRLYPNRLELWSDSGKQPELIFMDQIEEVCNDYVQIKNEQCIVIKLYNHSKYVLTNSDEIGLKEWHVSLKSAHKESVDMMTRMAEKATKIYGTEIPLKHMGKRRQQLQLEANISNSAIANLEQKIIQKELQASSRSPGVPAAAAAAAATATITTTTSRPTTARGIENVCPAAVAVAAGAAISQAPPVVGGHPHSQVIPHRHHRGHHQHRTHHHRHHHHAAKHAAGSGWSSSAAVGHHHHHRHNTATSRHQLSRPTQLATSTTGNVVQKEQQPQQRPSDTVDHGTTTEQESGKQQQQQEQQQEQQQQQQQQQDPRNQQTTALKEEEEVEKPIQVDSAIFSGEMPSEPVVDQCIKTELIDADQIEDKKDNQDEKSNESTVSDKPTVEQRPEQESEDMREEVNPTNVQQSNSIDSSSSGRSGSCSTSSDASVGEEAVVVEEEKEQEEKNNDVVGSEGEKITQEVGINIDMTTDKKESKQVAGGARVSLQVTMPSLDQQQQQDLATAAAATTTTEQVSNIAKDIEQVVLEQTTSRPRLALSLENVSEHQEVLRDPSKRITSDNKQRELDLVAQYEKLNIGARNSSSSIEEEPPATC